MRKKLLIIGLFLTILPLLRLPDSFDTFLIVVIGLSIAGIAWFADSKNLNKF